MRHTCKLSIVGSAILAALLSAPAHAQNARTVSKQPSPTVPDITSARNCPRPADAKDAQVLTFDKGSLETKLVVSLGKGEFKVVTIRLSDRPNDPRPIVPVIEAARITQGKLQFYTPDLNTDPESISAKFVVITDMGGPQICWASPSSLIDEGAYPVTREAKPEVTPAASDPVSPAADRVSPAGPRVRGRISRLPGGTTTGQP